MEFFTEKMQFRNVRRVWVELANYVSTYWLKEVCQ